MLPVLGMVAMVRNCLAKKHVRVRSEWGELTVSLVDNASTRALLAMLPLTIEMRNDMRHEGSSNLAGLRHIGRTPTLFSGTIGLQDGRHLVVRWSDGQILEFDIVQLGSIVADVGILDLQGSFSLMIEPVS